MCSQQLSVLIEWIIGFVLHWINNLFISKISLAVFHNVFAFQKLPTWYICWLDWIRLSFSCDRKNTERYGVNKQNAPTTYSEKGNIGKGWLVWK